MATGTETEVEEEPVATGAEAAPPPAGQGQADGSPPADDQRPTDGEGEGGEGAADPQVLELRRKLTEMGEDKKAAVDFANRVLADPKLGPQARAILEGREPEGDNGEEKEEEELFTLFAGENAAKFKRLLELRDKRLKGEFGSALKPLARTVVNGRQTQAVTDALENAGLDAKVGRSPEFRQFQRQYEAENASWYATARANDPDAMADLLVSKFAASQKRPTRDAAAAREASLQRGGGAGARVATKGNEMEFDPRASDSFRQIAEIVKKGGTPVPKRAR